jgi:uncharacterized protein YceK
MRTARSLLALALLSFAGCGTLSNIGFLKECSSGGELRIYGGVVWDGRSVVDRPVLLVFMPVELPLSIAFDTLTLPWTISHSVSQGSRSSPKLPPPSEDP